MISIFWFRRDLRLHDNTGLCEALKKGTPVLPLFIFDREILDKLDDPSDARVSFIYTRLLELKKELEKYGSSLFIRYGKPIDVFKELMQSHKLSAVHTNHDYEPYAIERDGQVMKLLTSHGIAFHSHKDQVIFEKQEVVKESGAPYTVFTPYSKKWKTELLSKEISLHAFEIHSHNLFKTPPQLSIPLEAMNFKHNSLHLPAKEIDEDIIRNYNKTRDYPYLRGTSRLGLHLRFGTVSIRELVRIAIKENETFLNELIWREFYMMILWHFPHVVKNSFKPQYDRIAWRNDEREFEAWRNGMTGYPIVDAGMRELNRTGFMHNRLRMITASFLTKHLLIDWRWGEAYFAKKLLDFELASNNGGWQWAAGTGCDAAPYFRVFNPDLQTEKFDPMKEYIKKWVPEHSGPGYPSRIVDHALARERAISTFKNYL